MSQELAVIKQQIEAPQTLEKFTQIFSAVHKVDAAQAKNMYEVERFQFMKELQEKNIADVTPISAMGVFLDVVSNGLSFSSTAKHVYILSRSVKSGQKDGNKDIYEKRLYFQTQPDGKIYQAQRAGSIDHVTDPVIVYEGENFEAGERNGAKFLNHIVKFPRPSTKIVAGYVFKVYANGKREPFWMDVNDIERLKGYSSRNNRRWDKGAGQFIDGNPNQLYTSNNGQIDPGFFGAKLINFALKNVRKSGKPSQYEVEDYEPTQPQTVETNTVVTEEGEVLEQQTTMTEAF